jgi:hypothetical protein
MKETKIQTKGVEKTHKVNGETPRYNAKDRKNKDKREIMKRKENNGKDKNKDKSKK